MNKFYLTFGQKSPFRNGYVLIVAVDYENARNLVEDIFGNKWSNLYDENVWGKEEAALFPSGQVGKTLYAN